MRDGVGRAAGFRYRTGGNHGSRMSVPHGTGPPARTRGTQQAVTAETRGAH